MLYQGLGIVGEALEPGGSVGHGVARRIASAAAFGPPVVELVPIGQDVERVDARLVEFDHPLVAGGEVVDAAGCGLVGAPSVTVANCAEASLG